MTDRRQESEPRHAPASPGSGPQPPGTLRRMAGRAGGLVALLVVYGVLNGALYVGQGVLKRDEVAQAEALRTRLQSLDREIGTLADWLDEQERESRAIDELGARLDRPDLYSDAGAYERDRARLRRRVEAWNGEKVPAIQQALARHDSLVDVYNGLADEHNALAETAYSRWWLLPIPVPGGRGRH